MILPRSLPKSKEKIRIENFAKFLDSLSLRREIRSSKYSSFWLSAGSFHSFFPQLLIARSAVDDFTRENAMEKIISSWPTHKSWDWKNWMLLFFFSGNADFSFSSNIAWYYSEWVLYLTKFETLHIMTKLKVSFEIWYLFFPW